MRMYIHKITVMLTRRQYVCILKLCKGKKLSVSEFIREAIEEKFEREENV